MRKEIKSGSLFVVAVVLMLGLFAVANGQTTDQPNSPPQNQTPGPQAGPQPDLAQLNLTPDQIQKIRLINAELKDQRQAAMQRLRLSQRALAEAMESPTPNEALLDQRSREVADAQAATFRLRTLSEFRILQVLTPDQRMKLREMRAHNQQLRREQRIENGQRPRVLRRDNAFQDKPAANSNRTKPVQQTRKP